MDIVSYGMPGARVQCFTVTDHTHLSHHCLLLYHAWELPSGIFQVALASCLVERNVSEHFPRPKSKSLLSGLASAVLMSALVLAYVSIQIRPNTKGQRSGSCRVYHDDSVLVVIDDGTVFSSRCGSPHASHLPPVIPLVTSLWRTAFSCQLGVALGKNQFVKLGRHYLFLGLHILFECVCLPLFGLSQWPRVVGFYYYFVSICGQLGYVNLWNKI